MRMVWRDIYSFSNHCQIIDESFEAFLAITISLAESWLIFDIQYDMGEGACMNGHDEDLERKIQVGNTVGLVHDP